MCDEKLDEPLDAVYAYGRYLELLPENHPDREAVRAILAGLKERTLRKMAGDMVPAAEYAALEKEYDRLVEKNRKIEKKLIEQQRQLVELRRRKAAGGVK